MVKQDIRTDGQYASFNCLSHVKKKLNAKKVEFMLVNLSLSLGREEEK